MIGVVIANKDDEAGLPSKIKSLAAQTLPPAEIIVVDDGSADPWYWDSPLLHECHAVANAFRIRLQIIPTIFNHGVAAAQNQGIRALSVGIRYVFLPAMDDEILDFRMFEIATRALEQEPVAFWCGATVVRDEARGISFTQGPKQERTVRPEEVARELRSGTFRPQGSVSIWGRGYLEAVPQNPEHRWYHDVYVQVVAAHAWGYVQSPRIVGRFNLRHGYFESGVRSLANRDAVASIVRDLKASGAWDDVRRGPFLAQFGWPVLSRVPALLGLRLLPAILSRSARRAARKYLPGPVARLLIRIIYGTQRRNS